MTHEEKVQFVLGLIAKRIVEAADHEFRVQGTTDGEVLARVVQRFFDNAMLPRTNYQDNSGGWR